MNVIIYNPSRNLNQLIQKLEYIDGISIFFVLNEKEFINITNRFKPDMIFSNGTRKLSVFLKLQEINANLEIYLVDDLHSNLKLYDYKNVNKKVLLKDILER